MARSSDASFPLSLIRDKAIQVRQIRRVFLLALFFVVQSTLVLGIFYHNLLGSLVAGNAPLFFVSEDFGAASEVIPPIGAVLTQWMLVMLAINAVVTTAIAIYVLRKLGNPILAIKRALHEVGDGNLEVRLRENDSREFDELCIALNRAMNQVNSKIKEAKELTKVLDSLEDQPEPDREAVIQAMTECREVLSFFTVKASDEEGRQQSGQSKSANR